MMAFLAIAASAALAVCTAVKPLYLQNTVDAVGAGAGNALLLFGCYVASILGILVFEALRQLSIGKYLTNKTFALKGLVMAHIARMTPQKFQSENGQNYITVLNNEIDMLVESYYVTRLEFAYSILVLISSVAALLSINEYLALIIIISTVCPILAAMAQGKAVERRTNLYTQALESLNVMIGNLIRGYATVKVNHVELEYLRVLDEHNETAANAEFGKEKTKVRVNMLIGLLAYAGEAVMVAFSIYEISRGRLTVGALIGALQLSEMLAIPTNSISYQLSEMKGVKGIRRKIEALLDEPEDALERDSCPTIETIELRDVSFRYQEKQVFSHVSYRFEAGKKYLILGENGSGKSTLFKLLSGFETDYEGQILVNGTDIRELWPALYDRLGIVLQDAFMFDDTLLRNITLYRTELEDKVEPTLRELGMDAFLASHDLEQSYEVTKGNLSGGEKQKLALARVLAQEKRVIFLDEATSAMDKDSSYAILSRLLHSPELSIISIEHKPIPELLPMYDKILELKEKNIVERV